MTAPKVLISWSEDDAAHHRWVEALATRLRSGDGIDVTLDLWDAHPGDQLPELMERWIRESDFVLHVCTPLYAARFDSRVGGVGYEAQLIAAEALVKGNWRKFIPLIRTDDEKNARPSFLRGSRGLVLSGEPYSELNYAELVQTLRGSRPEKPPLCEPAPSVEPPGGGRGSTTASDDLEFRQRALLGLPEEEGRKQEGSVEARADAEQGQLDEHAPNEPGNEVMVRSLSPERVIGTTTSIAIRLVFSVVILAALHRVVFQDKPGAWVIVVIVIFVWSVAEARPSMAPGHESAAQRHRSVPRLTIIEWVIFLVAILIMFLVSIDFIVNNLDRMIFTLDLITTTLP